MENRILLVDDEEDIRDVLGIALSDIGWDVRSAGDGQEALSIFRKEPVPIVLTDIKMPGMDGIDLLRSLKNENPDTEVIMITGHGDLDLAIKSLKYEATDFITKPINEDALEIALKRARDRIRIRRQLREYTEHLEALVREKTELKDHLSSLGMMIGSISHGLKGLLTGLDGGMYLVESGFARENSSQIQEGWEVVKLMIERIRKMILDILYYAKKRDLNWEQVDVLEFASGVARIVEPKIRRHDIRLVTRFDPAAGDMKIDTGYVHSALMNILENAIDACLKDTGKPEHEIVFSASREGGHVRFTVADNGIGMDPETLEKIFTLFFSSKGREGTGFGLFISNRIIRQHGGEIRVRSVLRKGSEFTIIIPATPSEEVMSGETDGEMKGEPISYE